MRNLLIFAIAVVMLAVTLSFVSCERGGRHGDGVTSRFDTGKNGSDSSRTMSIEQAIAEAREYEPPASVTNSADFDPLVFEELRNELIRQLEAKKNTREISATVATSEQIVLNDILVVPQPDGSNEIRFSEMLNGDYDSSGEVGVSDITAIAQNYGSRVSDGEGDDALERKIDGDGDGEIGIPDITPIANNYLMTSPAAGSGSDGYDVWRIPADGRGDAELMTTVSNSIDGETGFGETRVFSAMDADPTRGVSFVREISNYGNITVQREVLDAPEDGFVPKTGHCTEREISSIDNEGNGYANGDYVYYISPHDDETPDSPPQFAVTVEHQNDFRFAGAPASCQIVVKSWGELVPVSYTMDWGVPDSCLTRDMGNS